MKHQQIVNNLLDKPTPANQLSALAVMQNELAWSLDKALNYTFDYLWKDSSDELILSLGSTKAVYILEIEDEDDTELGAVDWNVCLFFELKYEDDIIQKDIIVEEKIAFEEDRDLKEYKAQVKEHFKGALPLIMQYVNA